MDPAGKAKAQEQIDSNAALDWQPVEDFMLKFDVVKVKNYAEDIDSLLTFAGLFSAVLTAFVVETYGMLQVDDTTNLLLAGISSQLGQSLGSLNATISSILDGQNSSTTTTARWINALFFLSLIFSLAAAFFGILAKQWLREYMLWSHPTANARDNVLLRQARFDALDEWNVGAIIASVPALLELAMILFLVGVVILLWTLDTIVAIVITVAVVIFLGIVSAFTVLPIFFRRCPYRSPTAWALAVLYDFACAAVQYCRERWEDYADNVRRIREHPELHRSRAEWGLHCFLAVLGINLERDLRFRKEIRFEVPAKSWRERDFETENAGQISNAQVLKSIVNEIVKEQTHLTPQGEFVSPPNPMIPHDEFIIPNTATDIHHVTTLFHSLLWVQRACPDVSMRTRLQRCISTIHPAIAGRGYNPYKPYEPQTRMLTDWCLLGEARIWGYNTPLPGGWAEQVAFFRRLFARLFIFERRRVRDDMRIVAMINDAALFDRGTSRGVYDDVRSSLLAPLLALDLAYAVMHLPDAHKADNEKELMPTMVRRVLELMCALLDVWKSGVRRNETSLDLAWIHAFISESTVRDIVIHHYPGLWSSAIVVAAELNVRFSYSPDSGLTATENVYGTTFDGLSALIVAWFDHGRDFGSCVDEDLNLFVLLTSRWLRMCTTSEAPTNDAACVRAATILQRMIGLAEYAFEHGIFNCGCFDSLPWPRLLQRQILHTKLVQLGQGPALCQLLEVLARSVAERQLIPELVEAEDRHMGGHTSSSTGVQLSISRLRKMAHQAMGRNSHCPRCPHVFETGIVSGDSASDIPRFESFHDAVAELLAAQPQMPEPQIAFAMSTPPMGMPVTGGHHTGIVLPLMTAEEVLRMFSGSHQSLSGDRPYTPVDDPRPPTPSTSDEGDRDIGEQDSQNDQEADSPDGPSAKE